MNIRHIAFVAVAALVAAPALAAPQGGRGQLKAACQADIQNYCAGVQPGEGRVGKCLKDNQAKVSQGCKDALAKAKAKKAEKKAAQPAAPAPAVVPAQ